MYILSVFLQKKKDVSQDSDNGNGKWEQIFVLKHGSWEQ